MNYVGKLLSNFKGFYNEINSATLTGAIDVVIIKQEDGSYVSSPFHVRFGKMGVLRSREKVVDIEINGEAVDLHMKLGEAGEAFFVHEAQDESEVPAYLATSPICEDSAASLMEQGISRLHQQSLRADSRDQVISREDTPPKPMRSISEDDINVDYSGILVRQSGSQTDLNLDSVAMEKHTDQSNGVERRVRNSRGNEDEKPCVVRDDSMASLYYSAYEIKMESAGNPSRLECPRMDIAVQTEMSGAEIESKARERLRTLSETKSAVQSKSGTPPRGAFQQIPSIKTNHVSTSENSQKLANRNVTGLRSRDSESSLVSLDESKQPYVSQASPDTSDVKRAVRKRCKKRPERTKSQNARLGKESESSEENVDFPEGGMFGIDMDEDLETGSAVATMARSVSMPLRESGLDRQMGGVDKQRLTEEWASSQFASSHHPWSDADITPIMSPMASRPPSPKSDTELETGKFDSSAAQTLITGTGEEINKVDDIRWEWGEVPQPVSTHSQEGHVVSSKDPKQTPGGLFQFMRKTKKIRHQPEKEGIYLDDLNLDEMDPEVAALYLYSNKSGEGKLSVNVNLADEDTESGRGASLPQSPVSMEMQSHAQCNIFRPVTHRGSSKMPEVLMSLCGGLTGSETEQTTITEDRFSQCLVTYDDFSQNPAIINDTNLVVKINDKFYNWQMAGPMIMSLMCFHLPLSDTTVDNLVRQHRPKKESRRRGWYFWGRGEEEKEAKPSATSTHTPTSSPASSPPNSPQKWQTQRQGEEPKWTNQAEEAPKGEELKRRDSSEEDHVDQLGELQKMSKQSPKRPLHKSNSTSNFDAMTGPQKKYAKSLKLNSEEIERLHLREGHNTASFSVTTQYQGTARCDAHIYLWNWDDKLIISDIDGTITRSDVLGHVLPLVGKDWSQFGITTLYNEINKNGYKFVYLSARAIGQSTMTRAYLRSVTQENNQKLPEGPLLLSPSSLVSAFHKEVIERKPQEFKIGCLKDIRALFPLTCNPFVAGFGNKINDVWAYQEVGVPISRIFTVNHRGELRMETVSQFSSSYKKLSDIVDMFFPPILDDVDARNHPRKFHAADYSSFTYWRDPIPDVEIDIELLKIGKKEGKK